MVRTVFCLPVHVFAIKGVLFDYNLKELSCGRLSAIFQIFINKRWFIHYFLLCFALLLLHPKVKFRFLLPFGFHFIFNALFQTIANRIVYVLFLLAEYRKA
jgi:hypothetical protein